MAKIEITIEGVTFPQLRRFELIIRELFEAGIFNVRSGRAILHFDKDGMLGQIDLEYVRWRRAEKAQLTLDKLYENAIIEITSPTHDKERVAT